MKDEMSWIAKWLLFTVVAIGILTAIGWGWRYATAPIAGKVAAEQQLESAASRITAYNHYFNLCSAIQGYEGALVAQQAILEAADGDEAVRTRANIAGITAQRTRAIAQYNNDVAKAYTTGRFFDGQLPTKLSVKGTTQCAQ